MLVSFNKLNNAKVYEDMQYAWIYNLKPDI